MDELEDDYLLDLEGDRAENEFSSELEENPKVTKIALSMSIDSEFNGETPICFQYKVTGNVETLTSEGIETIPIDLNVIVVEKSFEQDIPDKVLFDFIGKTNCFVLFRDLINNPSQSFLIKTLLELLFDHYEFKPINSEDILITINLWFYFSLKDLNICFGPDIMKRFYLSKGSTIHQNRNVQGSMLFFNNDYKNNFKFRFKIKDLFGLDKYGLDSMSKEYGVTMAKLTELDSYKTCMDKAIKEKPMVFLNYAFTDVLIVHILKDQILETFNYLLTDIFKITDKKQLYTETNIPSTIGSLVHDMFLKYFNTTVLKDDDGLKLALFSQGILNRNVENYQENVKLFQRLLEIKSLSELREILDKEKENCNVEHNVEEQSEEKVVLDQVKLDQKQVKGFKKDVLGSNKNLTTKQRKKLSKQKEKIFILKDLIKTNKTLKYAAYQYGSVKCLVDKSSNNSLFSASSVSGGRVVNERPFTIQLKYAADLDIVTAYGTVLRSLLFPIGRPRTFFKTSNQTNKLTLKNFYDKYGSDLSQNYKIVVSGELSFSQDLLFSRVIKPDEQEKIIKEKNSDEPDSYKSKGDLILLRRELQNATITKPLWEIITKVASTQELSEINNLSVESAVFWLESDKVNSIEELAEAFLQDTKTFEYNMKKEMVEDNRTYAWFPMLFEPFIGMLVDLRKKLKKDPKKQALQNVIKLVINTMYGVICSVYFSINNVVVADLITSTIRGNAWLMAKALNLHMTVTDGGCCSLNEVTFLKGNKKPGLDVLSKFYLTNNKLIKQNTQRQYDFKPLAGLNWTNIFQNAEKDQTDLKKINELTNQHLVNFWEKYNLKINFKIEPKSFILKGSYLSKAHYYFIIFNEKTNTWDPNPFYRIRGFRYNPGFSEQNPIYDFLIFLTGPPNTFEQPSLKEKWEYKNKGVYFSQKILKIRSWVKSLDPDNVSKYGAYVLPGDSYIDTHHFRLNNTHFPVDTYEEFDSRSTRTLRKIKTKDGSTIQQTLFERYLLKTSIEDMILQMGENHLKRFRDIYY